MKIFPQNEGGLVEQKRYKLTYTLKKVSGELITIGSHNQSFTNNNIKISQNGNTINGKSSYITVEDNTTPYYVEITGTFFKNEDDSNPTLFIQPNRGSDIDVTCEITDIKLYEYNYKTSASDTTFYL